MATKLSLLHSINLYIVLILTPKNWFGHSKQAREYFLRRLLLKAGFMSEQMTGVFMRLIQKMAKQRVFSKLRKELQKSQHTTPLSKCFFSPLMPTRFFVSRRKYLFFCFNVVNFFFELIHSFVDLILAQNKKQEDELVSS